MYFNLSLPFQIDNPATPKKKKDRQSCGITMFDAVFCVVLLFSAYDATVLNV